MSSIIENVRNADWKHLLPHRAPGDDEVNVGTGERWASAALGAALVAFSLRRHRLRGLLVPLGTGLVARGISGRCALNRALGRNSARRERVASPVASVAGGEGVKVERSVMVDRPPEEVFAFWRDFENLPRFMDHLESVTVLDGRRSHWVAKGPAGTRVEWDAEIHNEIPGRLIAWRSLPGADVPNAGSVHFEPVYGGRGTAVRVVLSYEPPAGRAGAAVATLFGEEPSQQVEDDLRRLKQVLEATDAGAGAPAALR
ncbi:MAG TPA: SRPBCC family protein [Gemmatimonadales bacterium]|nr:SRPBCC family protein [Gemmatimonadales bacterium]